MAHEIIRTKSARLFVILGGFFVTNALLAEVIGVKIFSLEKTLGFTPLDMQWLGNSLSLNFTAGVIIWPVVFIMTDLINEYYGPRGVRLLSYLTAGLILFAFLIFYGAMSLAPADFFVSSKVGSGVPNMELAYQMVLGQGGWIIVGSLTAFLVGQLVDVYAFHRIKKWTGEKRLWMRATGSTLISQFIDSYVVLFVAFYIGTRVNAKPGDYVWPFSLFLAVGTLNYIYKALVALILTPLLYLVHEAIERYLGKSTAALMKAKAMEEEVIG